MQDGPAFQTQRKGRSDGGRKPTTTFVEVNQNKKSKMTTSGGPGPMTGGKQGKYLQPY